MPLLNMHYHRHARSLCDCEKHREARQAANRAHEISLEITEAEEAGNHAKVEELLPELERLNDIVNQEIQ